MMLSVPHTNSAKKGGSLFPVILSSLYKSPIF